MDVRALIERHEGRVSYAYQDSLGFWTIGVGHLIDPRKHGRLPESIIDALLDHDIAETGQALYKALPWLAGLDPVRRAVLIDMAFNLGVEGLLDFKHTLEAVHASAFGAAADQMLISRWAVQVGDRAAELAAMMRTGDWPT